jgi:ATP-dependent DNA helicase RecG
MEALQCRDRKGFVSTYITPNIEAGYIAILYPETPNHSMQSYYLTNKGREALKNL